MAAPEIPPDPRSATGSGVSHVSDTARWVAIYRAMETERSDAWFRDPWARKLAGPEGEAIVRNMPKGRSMAWPMIVRTQVMDELIMKAIEEDRVDGVVNLASGLDARPFRMTLPPSLRWFDVDFPDVIAYKQTVLGREQPRCQLEFVGVDLTNESARAAFLQRVGRSISRALVITEGLLVYLQAEQVALLAADLGAQDFLRWWLIDLASPELLKRLEKTWGKTLRQAPLIFGPAEGTKFFEPYGWREKEYRSTFDESIRLKRTMPFSWFFKLLGRLASREKQERFKRFSGIVMMEKR